MPKHSLNADQERVLQSASRNAVQETLSSLGRYFRKCRWVGGNNEYRKNTIENLKADLGHGLTTKNNKQLSEYIASSVLLHCIDGWIYLGKALCAHTYNDKNTAHHLAYYAELRAAMSLLACEGIAIFSGKHVVVDRNRQCVEIPLTPRTHIFTWLALDYWSKLNRSSSLLMQIISPSGIPLQDWLDEFFPGVSEHIGNQWLKTWGLDLKSISQDHNGRNEVSYRPTCLNYCTPINVLETSEFIRRLWELFEPMEASRFEFIDRYLLRASIRKAFYARMRYSPKTRPRVFEEQVDLLLDNINPVGLPRLALKDLILDNSTNILLSEASRVDSVYSSRHHLQVIARAVLLLRVATGSASLLFGEAGFDGEDLEFWWRQFGEDIGLWVPPFNTRIVDLWADIEVALDDLALWENENSIDASYPDWRRSLAQELSNLGNCERILLWGLGL